MSVDLPSVSQNIPEKKINSDEEDFSESESESNENENLIIPEDKFITEKELENKCTENSDLIDPLDLLDLLIKDTQILRPSFQNISAAYADEVPFLVDGDSLMITLMNDKNWSSQLGGSTLHLVYLFERYLKIFEERGGTFYIVFFNCWRNIWKENWNVLLYRSILINHFKRNTSYPVQMFNNCFDKRFLQFLSCIRPAFILFNMDSYLSCSYLKNIDRNILRNITNVNLIMWLYFDLPCIDTNFIQVDISVLKGYYLEANPSVRGVVKCWGGTFEKLIKELPKIEECLIVPKLITLSPNESIRKGVFLNAATIFYEINKDDELIKAFFLTEALMEFLQLKSRSCPVFTNPSFELNEIIDEWHKCVYFAIMNIENENLNWTTISDMWQGILFGHVCRFAVNEINSENLGTELATNYENIVNNFNSSGSYCINLYPIHLTMSLNLNWEILDSLQVFHNELIQVPLIPIQNPLLLEFCGDILEKINWTQPPSDLFIKNTEEHDVLYTFHDEYDFIKDTFAKVPTDPQERRWYFKKINAQARHMSIYGASIEGRPLEISSVVRNLKTKKNGKDSKEKPQKHSKKAQQIIDKSNENKLKILEKGEKQYIVKIEESMKKINANYEEILNYIDKIIIKIHPDSIYQIDALFCKLKALMRILKNNNNLNQNKILEIKKNIYLCSRKICTFKHLNISQKLKDFLSKCLNIIDCNEIARRNGLPVHDASTSSSTNDTWIRFQLEKLGPELIREVSGKPDLRAKNFIPDPWQKKLFDLVDQKESAVIVAPTSSGKTYASYYCMESVLRESADGVVVYVAPTKALVNQVAATVYARFKDTKMPDGMSVYGVFTRDYKTNATNSQILVTVPQALEILLVSPKHHTWLQKLKYVIFDEVHCIAGDLGAVSFERCLLLIRCPFLALSATVRYPRLLQSWLQKAEDYKQLRDIKDGVTEKHSYKVNLVEHSERHSDLIKYTYGNSELHHLHPFASIDERAIRNHNGFPKQIDLSPAETMQLYDAMFIVNPTSNELEKLSPEQYFSLKPINGFISRNMVNDYANELKLLLKTWYENNLSSFENTIKYLKSENIDDVVGTGYNYILENIVEFVLNLERKNMLPAIIFVYNRKLINLLTKELTEYFVKSKNQINRRGDKKAMKQQKAVKKIKEKIAAKEKMESSAKRYSKTLNLLSNNTGNSLQGIGTMTSDDIKNIERNLMRAGFKPNDTWTNAIQNGIMMHHGGLGAKIRSSVEMLFRDKILNVVFATGTLALGIHMPCKTTVVAGNSAYLNSLEYQQMAGRAGRRGYDTTGNVIFFGLNPRKQHSLLTAKLPDLKGNYPVTVSFVLRLMLLVSNVTEKEKKSETATKITISRVMALLENSLSYMHNANIKINIKHFFNFSVQLLINQEYLNDNGEPLKWCNLVTHLHYHEPGNLALAHLLRSGAIRKLCTDNDNPQELLIIVLSHLFNRIPINFTSKQEFKNSKVILEPLPDVIKESLEFYNKQIKFVFDQYLLNVASYFNEEDNELPLSSVKFVGNHSSSDIYDYKLDNLQNKFLNMCAPKSVCSSFAGLSGNDDSDLYSSENLINNIKQKMSTDVKVIPLIDIKTELNSYALDFYRHGIIQAIRNDNGLKSGEEFILITDFVYILSIIVLTFEQMNVKHDDIVYINFNKLKCSYQKLYDKVFGSAHF